MPEFRVDPLTGLRALVATERADRPGAWATQAADGSAATLDPATDPFAPGHEAQTPPEVFAVRPDGSAPDTPGWAVRVVPNRFPALTPDAADPERSHDPDLFTATAARGAHEVIVNAPDAVASLADLTREQVTAAMEVWRARMRAHRELGAACVHVCVNEQAAGGASLLHTHAQLFALDFVPAQIARERERFGAHATRTMGGNLLQDLVQEEVRQRTRLVAIDDEAVLLAPYASRLPYQLMLAPRVPRAAFEDAGPLGSALLHEGLSRLRRTLGFLPPLNLWVRTAPRGADHFCWRIDVVPRLTHLAGLELGTGLALNVVAPENAAAELRDA
jgi:UDPglucose--hexose-1-phosphate uridylyltransferase